MITSSTDILLGPLLFAVGPRYIRDDAWFVGSIYDQSRVLVLRITCRLSRCSLGVESCCE